MNLANSYINMVTREVGDPETEDSEESVVYKALTIQ